MPPPDAALEVAPESVRPPVVADRPPERSGDALPQALAQILQLHQTAGNQAVTGAVAPDPNAPLRSPDPEVDGRTPVQVTDDLRGRDERYRDTIPSFRRTTRATHDAEQNWYRELGLMGGFIDWFNPVDQTDPSRWARVYPMWDEAEAAFTNALAYAQPATLTVFTARSGEAMTVFQRAYDLDGQYRAEYGDYLRGFTQSAQTIHTVAVVTRDLSFAVAVGIAVVLAAPVVVPAVAGAVASTGATGALATGLTYAGSGLVFGGIGAGIEGVGQGLGALTAQTAGAISDLIRGSERAADNFDFGIVAREGWDGMQRGFIDGVLAITGLAAERALAGPIAQQVRVWLGPGASTLMAMVIRRALTRAISGGLTGSVIGALQAGLNAARQGQSLEQIASAMRTGFIVGGIGGVVFGAAGGAWEARTADQLRQRVLAELATLPPAPSVGGTVDDIIANDVLVGGLLRQLRDNPTPQNQRLLELIPDVYRSLNDPDTIARAVAEVSMEMNVLPLTAPRDPTARFTAAVQSLSGRTGAPVVTIPRTGPPLGPAEFFEQYVSRAPRFFDPQAAGFGQGHGASTHLIQELAVDRGLWRFGMQSHEFRQLLAGATGDGGRAIGNDLWIELFDAFTYRINQPEYLFPRISAALGGNIE